MVKMNKIWSRSILWWPDRIVIGTVVGSVVVVVGNVVVVVDNVTV